LTSKVNKSGINNFKKKSPGSKAINNTLFFAVLRWQRFRKKTGKVMFIKNDFEPLNRLDGGT